MSQDSDRALLHRLVLLMGWPQWDWEQGDANFLAGVTFWADLGYGCGLSVYRPGDETGACWNPLTSTADALELAEHLTGRDSVWCVEIDRAYEHTWGEGPRGWSATFFKRGYLPEASSAWASTFARAVSLAALKAAEK